jgi:hypothetical protein
MRIWLRGQSERNFAGGPNVRDAASELAPDEVLDSLNISYDERGGAVERLGMAKFNGSAYGGGVVQNEWWSTTAGALIVQAGASLYKGTSTVANKTFSTSARVGFADFAGKLCVIHPVDGLFTSTDGVTFTVVADVDAPKGNCLEVWQNKLWSAGDPTNKARVTWSVAGDPTNYSATDFNEIRTKDNEQIVALKIAPGIDVLGRSGLIACKQESTYRIFDPATGAYEVIDATTGAASALSVVPIGAKVLTLSRRGIHEWQMGQIGMRNVSDRFLPLWDPAQINLTKLDLFCAGRKKNRALFSLCHGASTANDLALEYHPDQGWLAPHSNAASCYATSQGTTDVVYAGSPTVTGQVYQMDSGGTDDGAAISWRFQTRWFEPNGGFLAALWQLRLHGRGSGTLTVLHDFQLGGGDSQTFDLTGTGNAFYDAGLHWDDGGFYSIPTAQNTQPIFSLGTCRQFSLKFTGSSSTVAAGQAILGGVSPTVGFFAVYGFEVEYVPMFLA